MVLNDGVGLWSDDSMWTAAATATWGHGDFCAACHGGDRVTGCCLVKVCR